MYEDAEGIDFLQPAFEWIKDNEPKNKQNVLCHGDFHPLNVLVEDDKVSGVLDWSMSRIGEPERDIASTIMDITIYGSLVAPDYNYELFFKRYLEEYQNHSEIDLDKLNYYKALVAVANIEGFELGDMATVIPQEVKQIPRSLFRKYSGISL